jgi:hypothetical protein
VPIGNRRIGNRWSAKGQRGLGGSGRGRFHPPETPVKRDDR